MLEFDKNMIFALTFFFSLSPLQACGLLLCTGHEPIAPASRRGSESAESSARVTAYTAPAPSASRASCEAEPRRLCGDTASRGGPHREYAVSEHVDLPLYEVPEHAYVFRPNTQDEAYMERHGRLAALHHCLASTHKYPRLSNLYRDAMLRSGSRPSADSRPSAARIDLGIKPAHLRLIRFDFLGALTTFCAKQKAANSEYIEVHHSLADVYWLNDAYAHPDLDYVLAKETPKTTGPSVLFVRASAHLERFSSLRSFDDLNSCFALLTRASQHNHPHSLWGIAYLLENIDLDDAAEATKKTIRTLLPALRHWAASAIHIINIDEPVPFVSHAAAAAR